MPSPRYERGDMPRRLGWDSAKQLTTSFNSSSLLAAACSLPVITDMHTRVRRAACRRQAARGQFCAGPGCLCALRATSHSHPRTLHSLPRCFDLPPQPMEELAVRAIWCNLPHVVGFSASCAIRSDWVSEAADPSPLPPRNQQPGDENSM
jgi:hypothetical protein